MSRKRKLQHVLLLMMAFSAVFFSVLTYCLREERFRPEYTQMLEAAQRMEHCMQAIKEHKLSLGLSPDSALDPNQTGMLGVSSSPITTTVGTLSAKRTSTSPHMAALIVRLLTECGVKPGDKVACGFSGSFPALNIAAVTACEAIGTEVIYITSVGASTYGANQPELTAPEMMEHLYKLGLISHSNAAVTLGGDRDCGTDRALIFEEDRVVYQKMLSRLEQANLAPITVEDYAENISWRTSVYGQDVTCFINVGGGLMNMGRSNAGYSLGYGILRRQVRLSEDSGMIEVFLSQNVPVINLLNLQSLCHEYNIPYDGAPPLEVGKGALYRKTAYPAAVIVFGLGTMAALLALYRKVEKTA